MQWSVDDGRLHDQWSHVRRSRWRLSSRPAISARYQHGHRRQPLRGLPRGLLRSLPVTLEHIQSEREQHRVVP
jgi:hypothetical protein